MTTKNIGHVNGYMNETQQYVSMQIHRVIPKKIKIGKWKKLTLDKTETNNPRTFWAKNIEVYDQDGNHTSISFYSDVNPKGE